MLYLEIDQHARQITISIRDESGDVVQARQVVSLLTVTSKTHRKRFRLLELARNRP
jgi:hypothetical protein